MAIKLVRAIFFSSLQFLLLFCVLLLLLSSAARWWSTHTQKKTRRAATKKTTKKTRHDIGPFSEHQILTTAATAAGAGEQQFVSGDW